MLKIDTINYITTDGYWDTDKTILPDLVRKFKVNTTVFAGAIGPLNYPNKKNYGFESFNQYRQKYRDRDPRECIDALKHFFKIYNQSKQRNSITFIVPGRNPYLLLLYYICLNKDRIVISTHNYKEHEGNRKTVMSLLKHLLYKKFSYIHFYSELQMKLFINDFPYKKGYYTNMPLKDFGQPSVKRTINKRTFLFFGLIRSYKHPELFIEAANKLSLHNANFIMAGSCDKDLWKSYESQITHKKQFYLKIQFIEDSDVANYFNQADFLVLPYADSTQSGPSLIAINYGIPIIASNLPSFANLIKNGSNGFLFKTGDVSDLTSKMKLAIEMTNEELHSMRLAQLEFKKKYSSKCTPSKTMLDIISNIESK